MKPFLFANESEYRPENAPEESATPREDLTERLPSQDPELSRPLEQRSASDDDDSAWRVGSGSSKRTHSHVGLLVVPEIEKSKKWRW